MTGGKLHADLREAQLMLGAAADEERQLELLDPLTAEELALVQESMPGAGPMAVLQEARVRRRGRPKGVPNRRSDDVARMVAAHGPDPLVFLARTMAETEEAMLARSFANDPVKQRLRWAEARAMRIRAAEALLPYVHGKKPVQVDMSFSGLSDLVIAGVTHSDAQVAQIIEADFAPLEDNPYLEDDE